MIDTSLVTRSFVIFFFGVLVFSFVSLTWLFDSCADKFAYQSAFLDSNHFKKVFLNQVWSRYDVSYSLARGDLILWSSLDYFPTFVDNVSSVMQSSICGISLHDGLSNNSVVLPIDFVDCHKKFEADFFISNNLSMKVCYDVTQKYEQVQNFFIKAVLIVITILLVLMIGCIYLRHLYQRALSCQYKINAQLKADREIAEKDSLNKSSFIANITHELRTPLNSIIGFSKIICARSDIEIEKCKEYAHEINVSGNHLLCLINDVLDFLKTESNELKIQNSSFDVCKMLNSCIKMLTPKAEENNIELERNFGVLSLVINSDQKRMKQVIINILSNAIKFSSSGCKVVLSLHENDNDGSVVIKVEDNGVGISDNDLARVMSVFGRVKSSLNNSVEGTGLGLPLSKKLVEAMGGVFSLKSVPGEGTKIILHFDKKCIVDINKV